MAHASNRRHRAAGSGDRTYLAANVIFVENLRPAKSNVERLTVTIGGMIP